MEITSGRVEHIQGRAYKGNPQGYVKGASGSFIYAKAMLDRARSCQDNYSGNQPRKNSASLPS
jgi:hypothetical protein